jgi:uncharacterized protein YkwD
MAGFELARIGTVTEAAREWRIGRYLPLYFAGIAGGVVIGLALSFYSDSRVPVERHADAAVVSAPANAVSAAPKVDSNTAADSGVGSVTTIASPQTEIDAIFALAGAAEPQVLPAAPVAAAPTAAAPENPPVFKVLVPAQPNAPAQPASAPASVPQAAAPAVPVAAAPAVDSKPNFYVPPVSAAGPSVLEQQLFDDMNAERAKAGLAAYSYDEGLTKIARTRSQQMADQNYFAHTDPNGYSMYTELLAYFGYDSYNWAGENLAMNNYDSAEAAQRATVSLMASATHRANILATDFYRVGIGEVTTADGRHIFTMIFLG